MDAEVRGTVYNHDPHHRLVLEAKGTRLSISGVVVTKPRYPFKTREENHARFQKGWGHYKAALEADRVARGGK